jgi:hypothetical protein
MAEEKLARRSRTRPLAPLTGTAFDWVRIPVPCANPQCQQSSLQPLRQLVASDHTTCRSCRTTIDLTVEPWRTLIAHSADLYKSFAISGTS